MRRVARLTTSMGWCRRLTIQPEKTRDPARFPLGYVPLQGNESFDFVYGLLREGHYVSSLKRLEHIDEIHHGVSRLIEAERPTANFDDFIVQQQVKQGLLSRILVVRDFWELSDWNDPYLVKSFGLQNRFYDTYQWTQRLCHDFKDFVEKVYPQVEHTHLSYDEYVSLLIRFVRLDVGVQYAPAIPKKFRFRLDYGVPLPSKLQTEQLLLFKRWLKAWMPSLAIRKTLHPNCGNGATAFLARSAGVPMVRGVDPSPISIKCCRENGTRHGYWFRDMGWRVGDMLPEANQEQFGEGGAHKYDAIVYSADAPLLEDPSSHCRYPFAPGLAGTAGELEKLFEGAKPYLRETGVIIILTSNFRSLAYPQKSNPIEREIRENRRWVLLDYVDVDAKQADRSALPTDSTPKRGSPLLSSILRKLRLECWVLHPVDKIAHFGWLHQIPGAKPPPHLAGRWRFQTLQSKRTHMMRDKVQMMGMDWGDYKSRLINMLREDTTPEDDVARSIRMALDPTYAEKLAEESRVAVESKLSNDQEFHERVMAEYPTEDVSPRMKFNQWASSVRDQHPVRPRRETMDDDGNDGAVLERSL